MERREFLRLSGLSFAYALVVGVMGCGIISHQSLNTGAEVTDDQLTKIKPGMDKDEVLIILGEPTRVKKLSDGRKVWLYCWQRGGSTSFLWNTVGSTSAKSYCVTVVFGKDGKVLKTGKGRGGSAQITPTFKIREEKVTVPTKGGDEEL